MNIGIGGCSRSGKSTLASRLAASKPSSKIFSLDDYAFSKNTLPLIGKRYNWEIPEAYDFNRLLHDIHNAEFDYVLVEGILVFYDPRIEGLFDTKIFMSIGKSTFLERRRLETRWGDEPDWFLEYVWTSYLNYGKVDGQQNYLIISGRQESDMESLNKKLDWH